MIVFLLFIVVLLIGLTTAAVMGRIGGFMGDATTSQSFDGVPVGVLAGPLPVEDLTQLRFDQGLRGYRMDQVDEVIDALCARVRELEAQVAVRSALGSPPQSATDHDLSTEPRE